MKSGVLRRGALAALATAGVVHGAESYVWTGAGGNDYSNSANWDCTGTCSAVGYPDSTDADASIAQEPILKLDVSAQADDVVIVFDLVDIPMSIDGEDTVHTLEAETITFTSETGGIVDLIGSAVITTVNR